MRTRTALIGLAGLTAGMMINAPVAGAADGDGAVADSLDEIVVTARRRDESFRDVPMTVNVFTAQAIEAAGIRRPADFIAQVPNMQLVETQNAGNAFVVVRGISQARNSEPSVAVLVDGVLETNPAEFNKALFDIEHIEVLKGPQGAIYGRNAIGGAIIIDTRAPTNDFEGQVRLTAGNGSTYGVQGAASGPLSDDGALKFRASINYLDTGGFLDNVYLNRKADPMRDLSGRVRLLWQPSDAFSADLRLSASSLDTRALYFVIPRDDESNPFASFTTAANANDVTTPITLDNPGENTRDVYNAALKMDFALNLGTLTSVTALNSTREVLTGDAYDFRPAAQSVFMAVRGTDLNQSQFLDLGSWSQELRLTSNTQGRVSWIAGAYFVHTDRFISTGNMLDTGAGVFAVYRQPRLTGPNPSDTFLADAQNNNAWALFGDVNLTLTEQWELDLALRYDQDRRENITKTPTAFLPDPSAREGEVRRRTWDEWQPKATLRYKPLDNLTVYGGWSRGFRSGGFNQTGVGAVADANAIAGVNDIFEAEVADTWEVGLKAQSASGAVSGSLSLFQTDSRNGYFFVFLAANSTQNLGNFDSRLKGGEVELRWRPLNQLEFNAGWGFTNSRITAMEDASVIGNNAPLVTDNTLNLGAQFTQPLSGDLGLLLRADFQRLGRTWWEPYNLTSRDPVSLLDARLGLTADNWSLVAWARNLTDEKYNAEYSPGGFLFRALPRRYGLEFNYRF
ncbi:MAG: TonB-dependent receptor [Nevskiaceae bacterium]|nr:TonB-dependent receptor [Nevskiaceae bacterium]